MKGSFAKRIVLFVATNAAVLFIASIVLRLLGVDDLLAQGRTGLDLPTLLVFAAVFGFTGSLFSLAISKRMALWSTGAKVIDMPRSSEERWLVDTVDRLAQRAGIGRPDVAIFDSPELNAFATGARRNHALVAVSSGLLRGMTRDEVEAVLGHELAHVANGDMVTLTLIQGVVNTFVIFLSRVVGFLVDRFVLRSEDDEGYGIGYFATVLVAQLTLGILATVIVMWFSRRREFRADAGSAELVGAPAMVSALQRLRARSGEGTALPASVQAFGIHGEGRFASLFHSHPPLEQRIAALQGERRTAGDLAYSAPRNG